MLIPFALLLTQAEIQVPFRETDHAIIVDAKLNSHPVTLMFDTGFSGAVVLHDGIDIGAPTGTVRMQDFVGAFQASVVKLKSFQLGGKSFSAKMEAVQQPMAHLSLEYSTHTDGILGFEPMRGEVFEINFQKHKLIFHPKNLDITQMKPDNKRTFLVKMLPTGPNVMLGVKTDSGESMALALDTGNAFYATTHKDVLQRVGIWPADRKPDFMKTAWVASGPVDSWYLRMPPLKIFGVPVESSVWSIIDLPSSSAEADGTVGYGFLKHFNIIIDSERRRVWLERFDDRVSEDEPGDIGISTFPDPKTRRLTIMRVTPGSPAEKAGLKEKDQVLGVDGTDVEMLPPGQYSQLFEGKPGTKVKLAISRQGALMRFELERVSLVNEVKP